MLSLTEFGNRLRLNNRMRAAFEYELRQMGETFNLRTFGEWERLYVPFSRKSRTRSV